MYLPLTVVLPSSTPRDTLAPRATSPRVSSRPTQRDGSHDFDFEIGRWNVQSARLLRPLTGSTEWAPFNGTSNASRIFNRGAVLVELESDAPGGYGEGLLLRLYNPDSHQWSVSFASAAGGGLARPQIGEFRGGRGEFHGQDVVNGRGVYSRSVISDITPVSFTLEHALSDDGGRTWEVNRVSRHTRIAR
jgi:hypothetical protein